MTLIDDKIKEARHAWKMMMKYITCKLCDRNDPYRKERIYYYNKKWCEINYDIRNGKYDKA